MKPNIKILAAIIVLFSACSIFPAEIKSYSLLSPDGRIKLDISIGDKITYSVSSDGAALINPSIISMTVNNAELGKNPVVDDVDRDEVNELIYPLIKVKSAVIQDNYNQLRIDFKKNYSLIFRAYNEGVAYRFATDMKGKVKVNGENAEFNFAGDYYTYFPEEESFFTHMERAYLYKKLSEVGAGKFCSVPAIVDCGAAKVAITESDLLSYPGFYLSPGSAANSFKCIFPHYPLEEKVANDRDVPVTKYADYLAETSGKRNYPWRVIAIAHNDGELLTNQMVYKLASPSKLENTDWIKPGKVAWDWWNDLNLYGVDFKAGLNTDTYKYYVDFASANKIEYIILDEGWYKLGDLFKHNPDINLPELIEYGKKKNVGIILWMSWKTLNDQFDAALDEFQRLGVKGIKVDFMQRDDQWMVDYYEKTAMAAAKRHLLVDYHGAYKPTGWARTFPNVLTSEGVRGNEWNKWTDYLTVEHTVQIPFIRMLAGPMDFTPGGMLNANKNEYRSSNSRPMVQGTRCHQLAMYVIYESPLQMLCDNPSNYMREKECLDFISGAPTVWDTTVVLDAKLAKYILMARRSGADWYIGGMTGTESKDFNIDFSFLGSGDYAIDYYQDGINSERYAADYKKTNRNISSTDKLNIHLAPGGGWAARIYKK